MSKLELISFKLCPFVQRSVIMLLEKGVDYDITYIDLKQPPDWFQAISPFGKVPVLRIGDDVLFESAAINEYIDETHPPSMHPADPLRRAHNRAWIEFGSSLNLGLHDIMTAKGSAALDKCSDTMRIKLARVEEQLGQGPFFNGADFCLIDAAYAPTLMRIQLLHDIHGLQLSAGLDKLQAWSQILLARDSVQQSVVEDFPGLFRNFVAAQEGDISLRR